MKHRLNRVFAQVARNLSHRSPGIFSSGCMAALAVIAVQSSAFADGRLIVEQRTMADQADVQFPGDAAAASHDTVTVSINIGADHSLDGQLSFMLDGRMITLTHWPHSVRGGSFRVLAHVDDGSLVEIDTEPARTIRGQIDEWPGSMVAGSLLDDGLHARVFLPNGKAFVIEPAEHHDGSASAVPHVIAGVSREVLTSRDLVQSMDETASQELECQVAELAIDADFHMYQIYSEDEAAVVDRIESILNAVNVQYENEVGIIHEITEIIIRTSMALNPYTTNDPGMLLSQFRAVWNSEPEASIERAVAHLYTGRNLDGGVLSVAMIGVVCELENAYALIRDTPMAFTCVTDIVARTLGINWNASVCDCPDTTMHTMLTCANTFIGPGSNSVEEILAYKDSVDCLLECDGGACDMPGDVNCDGVVDGQDLLVLLGAWGDCPPQGDCPADLNNDGVVDGADLLILLSHWGG